MAVSEQSLFLPVHQEKNQIRAKSIQTGAEKHGFVMARLLASMFPSRSHRLVFQFIWALKGFFSGPGSPWLFGASFLAGWPKDAFLPSRSDRSTEPRPIECKYYMGRGSVNRSGRLGSRPSFGRPSKNCIRTAKEIRGRRKKRSGPKWI